MEILIYESGRQTSGKPIVCIVGNIKTRFDQWTGNSRKKNAQNVWIPTKSSKIFENCRISWITHEEQTEKYTSGYFSTLEIKPLKTH